MNIGIAITLTKDKVHVAIHADGIHYHNLLNMIETT